MIEVYRQKTTPEAAQADYEEIWPWLRRQYPKWQSILTPYWRRSTVDNEPLEEDPFQILLALPAPEGILNNWLAMQLLPAAREAINLYLADIAFSDTKV